MVRIKHIKYIQDNQKIDKNWCLLNKYPMFIKQSKFE